MDKDKSFLTYNRQMRKLRDDKNINCNGSGHKKILVRTGYFNLINGYKSPFVCDIDVKGNHVYLPGTSIDQINTVKKFDDDLRALVLKYIVQVEEEVRSLTAYKFDQYNEFGKIPWYDTEAYDPCKSLQKKMEIISETYKQLSTRKLEYVQFYMNNHDHIPTWIVTKAIDFSTFIKFLENSKKEVSHSLCNLYNMFDADGQSNVKLLIGSLHWLRMVRNSCAHNERIYCISRKTSSNNPNSDHSKNGRNHGKSGRIIETYFKQLPPYYRHNGEQCLFDLFVYFKYYLPGKEYKSFIKALSKMLKDLQESIMPNAFDNVRGKMGIRDLDDLNQLANLRKEEIDYNGFDKL